MGEKFMKSIGRKQLKDLVPGDTILWTYTENPFRIWEWSVVRECPDGRHRYNEAENALFEGYPPIEFDSLWYVGRPRPLDSWFDVEIELEETT